MGKTLVFLGPPGSGKGTVAEQLSKKYSFKHLSTGDLIRTEIKNQSKIGKKAQHLMEQGLLVPDDMTNELVLSHIKGNVILDGYPRTLDQAYYLKDHAEISGVIYFEMSEEIVIERLSERRVCPDCGATYHNLYLPSKKGDQCEICDRKLVRRKDDSPAIIKERLSIYQKLTIPLVQFFGDKVINVNAAALPQEVYKELEEKLKLLLSE